MTPLSAPCVLDQFYLEARSKLLDLAAVLDRLDRGEDAKAASADPRVGRIRKALLILLEQGTGRAERVQRLFSLDYEPDWPRPKPR